MSNKESTLFAIDKYCGEYEMPNLIKKCIQLINYNNLIFESPSFLKVIIRTITEILKSDELIGIDEITIFNGVNKWSVNYCN